MTVDLFPWVAVLAANQKAQLQSVWEDYNRLKRSAKASGMPVPLPLATKWMHFTGEAATKLALNNRVPALIRVHRWQFVQARFVRQFLRDQDAARSWSEYQDVARKHVFLLPFSLAAKLLAMPPHRVPSLIDGGQLQQWQMDGHSFVSGHSVEQYARQPRPGTRPRRKPWAPEEEKLLGTRSDCELAKILRRSQPGVSFRRRQLGIKPFPWRLQWTPEMNRLLGTASDAEIGRRLGISMKTVAMHRRSLRILDWGSSDYLDRLRRSSQSKKRAIRYTGTWTAKEERLLGTASDANVARRLGRTWCSVFERRKRLGILSWQMRKALRHCGRNAPAGPL